MTPVRAAAYAISSEAVRAAFAVPGEVQIMDVQGWFGYGAVGLWVLVFSLLVLRGIFFLDFWSTWGSHAPLHIFWL